MKNQDLFERSGGMCEAPGCPNRADDSAHLEGKKSGGRHGKWKKIWDDIRNRAALCRDHHNLIDLVRPEKYDGERDLVLNALKEIAGHDSWRQEYKIAGGK
jgi:predicted restriction endonuclease